MKFAIFLIKAFCGLLVAALFGGFVFYTYQYQQTPDSTSLAYANVSLIMFFISAIVLSLLYITFDVYQNKNTTNQLISALQNGAPAAVSAADNTSGAASLDILQALSSSNNETNQILTTQFQTLNNYMATLNTSASQNAEQMGAAITQLNAVCETISAHVTNIKEEKEKEVDHTGDFAVLIRTLSKLSSDLNDLNGRILDAINQISGDVSKIIRHHDHMNDDIKNISEKINFLHPEMQNAEIPDEDLRVKPEIFQPEEELEEPISVADFYEQSFNEKTEEPLVETPVVEENTFAMPTFEEPMVETPVVEENTFAMPTFEEPTAETPVVEENTFAMPTFEEPTTETPAVEENTFAMPTFEEPMVETPVVEENTFAMPTFEEPMVETPVVEENTPVDDDFSLTAANPFGTPMTNEMPTFEPTEPAVDLNELLGSDNPFGTPVSVETQEDAPTPVQAPLETEFVDDTASENQLSTIFNEDFANEIADLDILKDEPQQNETDKIAEEPDLSEFLK